MIEGLKPYAEGKLSGLPWLGRCPKNESVRRTMQTFVSHIVWESEVWIAEDPDHMIHFNGERFLGPDPDVMPTNS